MTLYFDKLNNLIDYQDPVQEMLPYSLPLKLCSRRVYTPVR